MNIVLERLRLIHRALLPGIAAFAILAALACSDDPTAPAATRIELRPVGPLELYVDDSLRLLVDGLDASGAPASPGRLTWTASDSTIATVDSSGRVRAVRPGLAVVRVHAEGAESEAIVRVVGFASVSTGTNYSCGILTDGRGVCWGAATRVGSRQWGNVARPTMIALDAPLQSISAGHNHACALTSANVPYCWGDNFYDALAVAHTEVPRSEVPVRITGVSALIELHASDHEYSCGVTPDSTAVCWGHNDFGQLGRGTISQREATIAPVLDAPKLARLTMSSRFHACGLTAAGEAWCWGEGRAWGDTVGAYPRAMRAMPGETFRDLLALQGRTCGLRMDGRVICDPWEADGTDPITLDSEVVLDSIAGSTQLCGTSAGELHCWSRSPDQPAPLPDPAPGLRFTSFDVSNSHACGVGERGIAWCWGSNGAGQLGDGTTTASDVPRRVANPSLP